MADYEPTMAYTVKYFTNSRAFNFANMAGHYHNIDEFILNFIMIITSPSSQ